MKMNQAIIYKKEVEIVKTYTPSCHNFIEIIFFYHLAGISDVSTDTFKTFNRLYNQSMMHTCRLTYDADIYILICSN